MAKLERVYDKRSSNDGRHYLVERLWPRGVKDPLTPPDHPSSGNRVSMALVLVALSIDRDTVQVSSRPLQDYRLGIRPA
jgi:hypothetical protein